MFSLLATTHDPENRFQKLNEIHRRRLHHWNCHTDSLTFVARSHHCHQALAMINNVTNDSLVYWIILWTLTIQFCWSKESTLLDKRAPIRIWIWWWRNYSELQRPETRSWFPSTDQGIGPLCSWSSVPAKLSEKVHSTPITLVQCGCR